jgi:nucleoid-associated protein YgaU
MGLFDFIQEAGAALKDKTLGSNSSDELTETVKVSPERINQLRGEQIASEIARLDIDGEQVAVDVNGGVAVLTGSAPSQETLEKIVLCAGNHSGIGQVDCQLQVDAPESAPVTPASPTQPEMESTFYTVQSGDTLGKIAQEHYGAAGKYMVIFEANQPMLSDPDKIYSGQQLRIPKL